MSQAPSRLMPGSSRLVRTLAGTLDAELKTHPEKFSERLSQKIDFSGSVKLSDAHGMARMIDRRVEAGLLSDVPDQEQGKVELEKCQQAFIRVRKAMNQSIEWSFDADKSLGRIKLPCLDEDFLHAARDGKLDNKMLDKAAQPYAKFYRAQQSDMSAKVQGLRVHVRDVLQAFSPSLAKLVELDKALDESLSVETRKFLTVVPKLLARHYVQSYETPVGISGDMFSSTDVETTTAEFLSSLKLLLKSELEMRLQLVLGLIEALNEEVQAASQN
jgi:Protein of unknown function (DUF3348)